MPHFKVSRRRFFFSNQHQGHFQRFQPFSQIAELTNLPFISWMSFHFFTPYQEPIEDAPITNSSSIIKKCHVPKCHVPYGFHESSLPIDFQRSYETQHGHPKRISFADAVSFQSQIIQKKRGKGRGRGKGSWLATLLEWM